MPGTQRSLSFIAFSFINAGALCLCLSSQVAAAVRVCSTPVVGPPQSAATELQARKQALEAWAKAAGTVPSAWRLAADKRTACAPIAGQSAPATTCIVRARPCLIDQAPGRNLLPELSPKPGTPTPSPTLPPPLPRSGGKPLNI
jgi:hypothetical protein